MIETDILNYLNHKSKLQNPSPNRFIKEVKNYLIDYFANINIIDVDIKILFYMFVNGMVCIPKCVYKNCNKHVRFIKYSSGFSNGCCPEHARKISNIDKFGCETPFQSHGIQKKVRRTFKEKYGGEYHINTKHFKDVMMTKYVAS